MKFNLDSLPILLKRKHLINEFGFSNSLYYKLVKSNSLPMIKFNGRNYIDRDKFIRLLEYGHYDKK